MMTIKKPLLIFLVIYSISFFFTSCEKDNDTPDIQHNPININKVLNQTTDNSILPTIQNFVTECKKFMQSADVFETDPSISNLTQLQSKWKETAYQWRICEVYSIGKIKDLYLYQRIYSWPANTVFIESNIHGTDSISLEYIKTKGSSSKGIAGIEYLLFSGRNANVILDSLKNSSFSERRMSYLKSCIEELKLNATNLEHEWLNYKSEFIANKGIGINSSFNQMINELINLDEKILQTKIGKPSGINSNQSADSTLLEAFRASYSMELIKANLEGLENCIFSNNSQKNGYSISDYSNSLVGNLILSDKIEAQFISTYMAMNVINLPLKKSLYIQQEHINRAYNEVKKLLVLLKVDLASQLSITLTINDNDGD